MHSAYHSLPTINNIKQGYGERFAAKVLNSNEQTAQISLDLAGAYPTEANLKSWTRTLNRDKNIQLTESYELSHPAEELTLSLITPCEITTTNEHIYLKTTSIDETRTSGTIQIKYEPTLLTPSIEEIRLGPTPVPNPVPNKTATTKRHLVI